MYTSPLCVFIFNRSLRKNACKRTFFQIIDIRKDSVYIKILRVYVAYIGSWCWYRNVVRVTKIQDLYQVEGQRAKTRVTRNIFVIGIHIQSVLLSHLFYVLRILKTCLRLSKIFYHIKTWIIHCLINLVSQHHLAPGSYDTWQITGCLGETKT